MEIHTVAFHSTAKPLDKVEKLKSHFNILIGKTKHHFRSGCTKENDLKKNTK